MYLSLLLVCCSLGVCLCVEYGSKLLPLQQRQCPSLQERERVRAQISAEVQAILSGGAIYSCNGSPGWRRVGFVNMTDPSQDCPPGLSITSHPIRTCGSSHTVGEQCSSTTFSVSGVEYSQVCGRIRAYQYGDTYALDSYVRRIRINQNYVDGLSLTHGAAGERQHVWTFAAGYAESFRTSSILCPCVSNNPTLNSPILDFVGRDYFCETGNNNSSRPTYTFFGSDPLWDGEGCGSTSTCCQFNNPPWFSKTLPAPTTDDIELRLCHLEPSSIGDVPIQLIELYIK